MTLAALLAALAAGVSHSPAPPQDCAYIVKAVALDNSQVMSGNMRTTSGGCIVWVSSGWVPDLTKKDVCQLGAHEGGHLAGLPHSTDPLSVMYSPFTPLRRSYC